MLSDSTPLVRQVAQGDRDWVVEARATGCRRVWLVTTNNNIAVIAFYQRLGMDVSALHRHAVFVSSQNATPHPA